MSGGRWDYVQRQIQWHCETIGTDADVAKRWPLSGKAYLELGRILERSGHDMDWDLESDTLIDVDDSTFDRRVVAELLDCLMALAPDEWFPRGKWATIQAVQQRSCGHKWPKNETRL